MDVHVKSCTISCRMRKRLGVGNSKFYSNDPTYLCHTSSPGVTTRPCEPTVEKIPSGLKYTLLLAIAEQAVETLLVYIVPNGIAHRVNARGAKVGGVNL